MGESQDDLEFSKMIRSAMPGRVISNFIAVYETLTEDGVDLRVITSDSMTPWLGLGMLQSAMDTLQGAEEIYMFGDMEDGEDE
jgi:hypothetical protein